MAGWPLFAVVVVVTAVVIFLTELTSNTATAAAFLPVVASLAVGIGADPMLLAIPAALAASCAFMLPVATPPNAIVYGTGALTVPQMAKAGLWLNLFFMGLLPLVVFGVAVRIFRM
jgi:sodium-dependent dicarboxylate transporter 2/3/5